MSFDRRERDLESLSSQAPTLAKSDDLWALRKEFQEFKVASEEREKAVSEREKLKDRLWKERLVFLGLLIASWVGLGAIIATLIPKP